MRPIKVVVHGALGKMGRQVVNAVLHHPELELVGAVEREVNQDYLPLPDSSKIIPFSSSLKKILKDYTPDVVVDFTIAEASMKAVHLATEQRVNLVIGTTGLSPDNLKEIEHLSQLHGVGIVVASNFSLGAVLLMHLAKIVAKYFDYAEIIEMHHHEKADAPSGTALATTRAMTEARNKPFSYASVTKESLAGTRGGQLSGIAIHSVRLPGILASQQVIAGGLGETLTLRHDTISRECYIPGVLLAIKEVVKRKGLIYGLETLLGL